MTEKCGDDNWQGGKMFLRRVSERADDTLGDTEHPRGNGVSSLLWLAFIPQVKACLPGSLEGEIV